MRVQVQHEGQGHVRVPADRTPQEAPKLGKPHNEIYRAWIAEDRRNTGLASVRYTSSVPRFCKRKNDLSDDEDFEIYVHPLEVDGILIDNFTGGNLLEDDINKLEGIECTSYFDLHSYSTP